mmetsp:Transcript_22464/g.76954  ORF Transcript_22464/g.76954 Transcript_22464/m.76954 type:complete len:350 (+) Transcript_22464:1259-2308(+)
MLAPSGAGRWKRRRPDRLGEADKPRPGQRRARDEGMGTRAARSGTEVSLLGFHHLQPAEGFPLHDREDRHRHRPRRSRRDTSPADAHTRPYPRLTRARDRRRRQGGRRRPRALRRDRGGAPLGLARRVGPGGHRGGGLPKGGALPAGREALPIPPGLAGANAALRADEGARARAPIVRRHAPRVVPQRGLRRALAERPTQLRDPLPHHPAGPTLSDDQVRAEGAAGVLEDDVQLRTRWSLASLHSHSWDGADPRPGPDAGREPSFRRPHQGAPEVLDPFPGDGRGRCGGLHIAVARGAGPSLAHGAGSARWQRRRLLQHHAADAVHTGGGSQQIAEGLGSRRRGDRLQR